MVKFIKLIDGAVLDTLAVLSLKTHGIQYTEKGATLFIPYTAILYIQYGVKTG